MRLTRSLGLDGPMPLASAALLLIAGLLAASQAWALPELDRLKHPVQLGLVAGPMPGVESPGRPSGRAPQLLVAASLQHREGWHTYWQNPGDSGLPTELRWTLVLPQGDVMPLEPEGPIQWPTPQRFAVGPLANYGYVGQVYLAQSLRLPDAVVANPALLQGAMVRLEADWLVCEEVCIPGSGKAELSLAEHSRQGEAGLGWMRRWRASLPVARSTPAPDWGAAIDAAAGEVRVWGPPGALALPEHLPPGLAMPLPSGLVKPSAGQLLHQRADGKGWVLSMPMASGPMRDRAMAQWAAQWKGKPPAAQRWNMVWAPAQGPAEAWSLPLRASSPAVGGLLKQIPSAQGESSPPRTPGSSGVPGSSGLPGPLNAGGPDSHPTLSGASANSVVSHHGAATSVPANAGLGLVTALVMALLGGILLNAMPCVFPVLGIKVLSLLGGQASQDAGGAAVRTALRRKGLFFLAGIEASLLSLAGIFLVLRAAGTEIGWGFQLQSPALLVFLAVLFLAISLNLLGLLEVRWTGGRVAAWAGALGSAGVAGTARSSDTAHALSRQDGVGSAFGTGVLTVVVATPCTAPFMGAALGYGLTQPALTALAVFAMLGLGLALPTLLLMAFPSWRQRLPRPGPWMLRMRQWLAFPMLGAVLWLLWVFSRQSSADLAFVVMVALLVLALAAWMVKPGAASGAGSGASAVPASGAGRRWGAATLALAGLMLALGAAGFAQQQADGPRSQALAVGANAQGDFQGLSAVEPIWQPWQPGLPERLAAEGKVVFLDATADWCIVCKVNKFTVLETDAVQRALAAPHVVALRADWTNPNPDIARLVQSFGRPGIPLNVIYRPGEAPVLLPEILSSRAVLQGLQP